MNYNFSTLPLFILMGAFVHRAKLSDDLYEAANAWLSHWRAGGDATDAQVQIS
jgi:C4-dicarboxylate transporter, DctM subunit